MILPLLWRRPGSCGGSCVGRCGGALLRPRGVVVAGGRHGLGGGSLVRPGRDLVAAGTSSGEAGAGDIVHFLGAVAVHIVYISFVCFVF